MVSTTPTAEWRPVALGAASVEDIPRAVKSVLGRRFLAQVGPDGAADVPFTADWLQASINVLAPAIGRFTLSVSVPLARELTAAFLGRWRDDDVPDQQIEELTGALAVMVCGAWLMKAGPSSCVDLSHPTVRHVEQPPDVRELRFIVNEQLLTIDVTTPEPALADEPNSVPGSAAPSNVAGPRRLLLVEDESTIRNLIRAMLADAGYEILEARSGEDALRLAAATPIDLLITDLGLPGMNGRELASRLRSTLPQLKALYVSGAPYEGQLSRDEQALSKPFTRRQLIALVTELSARSAA